jgi:benzoate membrane transport protein
MAAMPQIPLEPIARPLPSLGEIAAQITPVTVASAVVAFLFAASAPVAIILAAGAKGGLSESDLASWIFAAFALNSLVTLALSYLYRTPVAFFWTIPGTVLAGNALEHLSFSEVIGAYVATALLLLGLGLTGWIRAVMERIPMPIIMGMVAGVFLRFGLNWIGAFREDVWIALAMTAAFVLASAVPAIERRAPPMIAVLVTGCIMLVILGKTPALPETMSLADMVARPNFYVPAFSLQAMTELVIPLAVTVIAAQNGQGIAILTARGHKPPINALTAACGAGSLVTAAFGCVSTCLTGPCNAILTATGPHAGHFAAAILLALISILFGLFAPLFTTLMLATPPAFIATLAGLALLKVLQSAFQISFRADYSLGALIAFMVTLADYSIFGIGAAFWGLVFGLATSALLERDRETGT